MDKNVNFWEFLLFGIHHHQLHIVRVEGQYIYLENGYEIEYEGPNLYKLICNGSVIAPFSTVTSLCEFIIEDTNNNKN